VCFFEHLESLDAKCKRIICHVGGEQILIEWVLVVVGTRKNLHGVTQTAEGNFQQKEVVGMFDQSSTLLEREEMEGVA